MALGLSYGSALAYSFATRHPHLVERLVLGGATLKARPALRQMLRYSLGQQDRGELDALAQAMVSHMFNCCEANRVAPELIERLYDSLRGLGSEDLRRHRENTERVLRTEIPLRPFDRSTLVFAARHDNFVQPEEGVRIAEQCERGQFVLLERGDHLVPLEAPQLLGELYERFLEDRLGPSPDWRLGPPEERRGQARLAGRDRPVVLRGEDGCAVRGRLLDASKDGCAVALEVPVPATEGVTFELELSSDLPRLVLAPIAGGKVLRGLFLRHNFAARDHGQRVVDHLKKLPGG